MKTWASVISYLSRVTLGGVLLAATACVPAAVLHEDQAPTCGIAFPTACESCAERSCCDEASACANSPSCKLAANCLAECEGDAVCRTDCTVKFPGNDSALAAELAACLSGSCEKPCKLTCGALPGLVSSAASEGCQDCLANYHCGPQQACAANVDCQLYVACRRGCVTADCIGSCSIRRTPEADICYGGCSVTDCVRPCSSEFDEVVNLYAALYDSTASSECAKLCQSGGDWSCVGEISWPHVEARERSLTVGFSPRLPTTSRQGIKVKMCVRGDEECGAPIDSAYSDADGIVRLVDSTGATNGVGNGLDGFLKLSSAEIYPTKVYWGFPLSKKNGALGTSVPIFEPAALYFLLGDEALDPTRGMIGAIVVDCAGVAASDVEVDLGTDEPGVQRLYGRNTAAATEATKTDQTGTVFFTHVPVGKQTLTVTPNATGRASSVFQVDVRAGTLTEVGLAPTPL